MRGRAPVGKYAAGPSASLTRQDKRANLRKAITSVTAGGYTPDTVLIDPAGAEAIDLFGSSRSERFFTFGAGRFAPGELFGLSVRVAKSAGTAVVDAARSASLREPAQLGAL